jgi:hypothetical protein
MMVFAGICKNPQPKTEIGSLCQELGISRQTLYRHVDPKGKLREDGNKLLGRGTKPGAEVTPKNIK